MQYLNELDCQQYNIINKVQCVHMWDLNLQYVQLSVSDIFERTRVC